MSRAVALEQHSANQFLKTSTNLNFVQPKLFRVARQDDHRIFDCTGIGIQIHYDADVDLRVLSTQLRAALSATVKFSEEPHRLSE